jgi:hypothetical protein
VINRAGCFCGIVIGSTGSTTAKTDPEKAIVALNEQPHVIILPMNMITHFVNTGKLKLP